MSEIRGWSHNDMMSMSKTVFYRYYGYWIQERLMEEEEQKRAERKQAQNSRKNEPRSWKPM